MLLASLSYVALVSIGLVVESRQTDGRNDGQPGVPDPRDTQIILRSVRPEGIAASSKYGLTEEDIENLSANLSKDARIVPVRTFKAEVICGNNALSADLILTMFAYAESHRLFSRRAPSVTPGLPILVEGDEPEQIERGRGFFSEDEEISLARVAVLGPEAAKRLFADQDPVGNSVLVRNGPRWLVIGVLKSEAPYLAHDEVKSDRGVYVALRHFQGARGRSLKPASREPTLEQMRLSHIVVFAPDRDQVPSLAKRIRETLEKNHGAVEDWSVSSPLIDLKAENE